MILLRADAINVLPVNNAYGVGGARHGYEQRRHGDRGRQDA